MEKKIRVEIKNLLMGNIREECNMFSGDMVICFVLNREEASCKHIEGDMNVINAIVGELPPINELPVIMKHMVCHVIDKCTDNKKDKTVALCALTHLMEMERNRTIRDLVKRKDEGLTGLLKELERIVKEGN